MFFLEVLAHPLHRQLARFVGAPKLVDLAAPVAGDGLRDGLRLRRPAISVSNELVRAPVKQRAVLSHVRFLTVRRHFSVDAGGLLGVELR